MKSSRAWRAFPLFLLLVALAIYGRSLSGPFLNWDDNIYITGSRIVWNLSWDTVAQAFGGIQFTDYAPLNTIGLALQYKLWGPWVTGFRITNILLHVLNASLVFGILSALLCRRPLAAAGALVFLSHPVQVEVVAWVSQHKTLLSSSLMLASLLMHLQRKPRGLVAALAIAGMLVKPQAVVLPLMLVAADVFADRKRLLPAIADQIPLFLFAAAVAAANLFTQGLASTITPPHGGILSHAWGVLQLPGRYAVKLFAPYDLCALYNYDHMTAASVFFVLGTAVIVAVLSLAIKRERRLQALGVAWFLIALLPVLNLVPMVIWMADRYLYVPMLGVLLAAGSLVPTGMAGWRRAFAFVAVFTAVMILAAHSIFQSRIWVSDSALWTDTWSKSPGVVAGTNLASALAAEGRLADALTYADWVVNTAPNRARGWAIRGEIKRRAGLYREAARDFEKAVRLDPSRTVYVDALVESLDSMKGRPAAD